MSIWLTGDLHGAENVNRFSNARCLPMRTATAEDLFVILGDFGVLWENQPDRQERYALRWLEQRPAQFAFVDGNHENFSRLAACTVETWNGGRVHRIAENVVHLMRGQVFTVQGQRLFTMGGAQSTDRAHRKAGVSWWPEELPSPEDYAQAERSLAQCGWAVDYVLTHCAPSGVERQLFPPDGRSINGLTDFLERVEQRLSYRHHYFGHYHSNAQVDERHSLLCNQIVALGDRPQQMKKERMKHYGSD